MPNFAWYGKPLYRYRDLDTGRFIAASTIRDWSQASIEANVTTARELAEPVSEGRLTVGDWQQSMRDLIKTEAIKQAMLGAGGRAQMTDEYWGAVGGIIADQYRYLNNFAREVATGELSASQIAARSAMYIRSTKEAFEKMQSRIRGLPDMPQYPGDGRTPCLTNCGCHWEYTFRPSKNYWECCWVLGPVEHCDGCVANSLEWNPLIIEV